MIDDSLTYKYLELIDSVGLDDTVVECLKAFVKSYDGSNDGLFHLMVLSLIRFFGDTKLLQIKAKVFDEMLASKNQFDKSLEELNDVMEEVMNNVKPALSAPPDSI